jgi:hypothetical protein
MGLLGKLVLKLSANSAQFETNMKKARTSARSFGDVSTRAAGMAAKATAAAGVAIGAAAAVIIKANLESIDSLAKTADKLGMTTEALAGYRHAADLTGVSQGNFDKSLGRMSKNIGDAQAGIGTAKQYLDQLGLSAGKLAAMRPEDQFADIAEEINGLGTQTEKAAAAQAIFGRTGIDLLNTMRLGKDGLAATSAEAQALGLALSRVDAAKVEAANDAMTRMRAASSGFGKTLTVAVAPYLTAIADEITRASVASGGFRREIKAGLNTAIDGAILFGKSIAAVNIGVKAIVYNFLSVQEAIWETLTASRELNLSMRESLPDFLGGKGSEGYAEASRILSEQKIILAQIAADKQAALQAGAEALAQYEDLTAKAEAYRAAVEAGAQAAAEAVASSAPGNADMPDVETGISEAEAERYAAKLAALDNYLADEQDRLFNAAVARADMVTNAFDAGLLTEQSRNELLERIAADHDKRLTDISKKGAAQRAKFIDKSFADQVKTVSGGIMAMTQATASGNKTMFEINKAAAIANATVSTYEGAIAAYKAMAGIPVVGPALGAAAAAAVAAFGVAQVSAIASSSFGGGGAAPSVAATGASSMVAVTPAPAAEEPRQETGQITNIYVQGHVFDIYDTARQLAPEIKRAEGDGINRD